MSKRWEIDRRTFLRGLGTAISLPFLDAMMPSLARQARAAGTSVTTMFPRRMGFIYLPNGVNIDLWRPEAFGMDYVMPESLKPIEKYRKDFNIIAGLNQVTGEALGDGGGDHARASATFLTGVHPRKTNGADIHVGISVDQIAASKIGTNTKLPSLELSCDTSQMSGGCDTGYSCAYQYNISWKSPTMPMSSETDPKAAFHRLFGGGDGAESAEAQAKRTADRKSILDYVRDDANNLNSALGTSDKRKLDQYMTAIREIEQRMEQASKHEISAPAGVNEPTMFANRTEHIRLMMDMMVLAFQTDATRIVTFCLAHEGANKPYSWLGMQEGHHDISHHGGDPDKLAKLGVIDKFHYEQMGYFLEKMTAVQEGDGTLLDNSMVLMGSGLADPMRHIHENLPLVLAGRGGGTITTGRHIDLGEQGAPLNNLYLSMLDRVGAPIDRLGDSTSKLEVIA
jgi:hypothetical protein